MIFCQTAVLSSIYCRNNVTKHHKILLAVVGMGKVFSKKKGTKRYTSEADQLQINPLNAELNPICQLLILLGNLTIMGTCIVSIFQYSCISNKMLRYTVYLYPETALHVLGGTSTHQQERIHLYLQHLVFVTPLLLSAAIVEELEPV
jgi:hypothetical protein